MQGYFVQEFIDDPENEKNNIHISLFCSDLLTKVDCSIRFNNCYIKSKHCCCSV